MWIRISLLNDHTIERLEWLNILLFGQQQLDCRTISKVGLYGKLDTQITHTINCQQRELSLPLPAFVAGAPTREICTQRT